MPSMTVELTWNEDLGSNWMNEDNLGILLYSKGYTQRHLLQVQVLDNTENVDWAGLATGKYSGDLYNQLCSALGRNTSSQASSGVN